jgi:large subunit ribosomal protein L29
MKQKEIIELTDKQLKEMLGDEKLGYTKMRLSHSISSHENPMKLKETKKKIARILTEQKARIIKQSAADTAKK